MSQKDPEHRARMDASMLATIPFFLDYYFNLNDLEKRPFNDKVALSVAAAYSTAEEIEAIRDVAIAHIKETESKQN